MDEPLRLPISYALHPSDLYYGFPYRKNLTICDDFLYTIIRELCGRVLRHLFYYVVENVIENNTMFKFPPGCLAWLEMQPYSGEAFKIARQNGAFQDVDFLASDFTGYLIVIRFGNRYLKWLKRLYVSARHRDRITELTNLGKQLTSGKVSTVKDYLDKIQQAIPILSKSELSKICMFGLKRFAYAIRHHCDVAMVAANTAKITAFCGRLYMNDPEKFWRNWYTKYRMKERLLYYLKKKKWDGYYYIGLNIEEHNELMKQKGKFKTFKDAYLVKTVKELYHERWCYHIWRVPYPIDCGWKFYREKIRTDKAEYVGLNQYGKCHKYYKRRAGDGPPSTVS